MMTRIEFLLIFLRPAGFLLMAYALGLIVYLAIRLIFGISTFISGISSFGWLFAISIVALLLATALLFSFYQSLKIKLRKRKTFRLLALLYALEQLLTWSLHMTMGIICYKAWESNPIKVVAVLSVVSLIYMQRLYGDKMLEQKTSPFTDSTSL